MDKSKRKLVTVLLMLLLLQLILISLGCHRKDELQTDQGEKTTMGSSLQEYCGSQFSFFLPEAYQQVKTDTDEIVLTFKKGQSTLRVFKQELGEKLSAESYIEYSNEQLSQGKAGFEVLEERTYQIKEGTLRQINYKRPEIVGMEKDANFYTEVHFFNPQVTYVLTFWGKADQAEYTGLKADVLRAAKGVMGKREEVSITTKTEVEGVPESPHIQYTGSRLSVEILPNKLVWGRLFPGVPFYESSIEKMLESEKRLGHKFEVLMTYAAFPGECAFPAEAIQRVYQDERLLLLTLEPYSEKLDWIAVPEIISGQHDLQIKEWAEGLKKIGEPVFVRPLDEMNGGWAPWCAWFMGKDTELYIQAWRHIVDIFREVKADNVLFVWSPHEQSYPDFQWNNAHLYYPGDDYVDWIGLSGYNNGIVQREDVWREFEEIFKPLYTEYIQQYAEKPFMITEFSCNEAGGDKAKWIEKAMASLANNNYPNLKIATWFDSRDNAWLYQLDSSEEAWAAFQKGLGNYGYLKKAISTCQGSMSHSD